MAAVRKAAKFDRKTLADLSRKARAKKVRQLEMVLGSIGGGKSNAAMNDAMKTRKELFEKMNEEDKKAVTVVDDAAQPPTPSNDTVKRFSDIIAQFFPGGMLSQNPPPLTSNDPQNPFSPYPQNPFSPYAPNPYTTTTVDNTSGYPSGSGYWEGGKYPQSEKKEKTPEEIAEEKKRAIEEDEGRRGKLVAVVEWCIKGDVRKGVLFLQNNGAYTLMDYNGNPSANGSPGAMKDPMPRKLKIIHTIYNAEAEERKRYRRTKPEDDLYDIEILD